MPISNGSFAKTQSIQDVDVGEKPLAVSIHDRFKAMVKEKEEELNFFGGEAVLPLSTVEIVRIYEIFLSSLTFNSKPIITDLTIVAGEQRAHGEGIADAICARIIEMIGVKDTQVPVDQKLPSLYLLDSIVKNIGKDYIRYFSARLPEVFCDAYLQVNPNMQPAMRHLFGTWATVFPPSTLHKIETHLQFSPSIHGQRSTLNSLGALESTRPSHGIHINPKYLEAKHQFGHSTIDSVAAEGASSSGRVALTTSNLDALKKSIPSAAVVSKYVSSYGTGHGAPLSSSLEEYTVDSSPRRLHVKASPSGAAIDYRLSRGVDREEETSELQARNWIGNSTRHLKTSAFNHADTVDLRGPRALINAYGIDERDKDLKRKHQIGQQLEVNGIDQKVAIRTWQNTEEEEFDWEEDRKRGSEIYASIQPSGNLMTRHRFTTKYEAPLVNDYRGNWSNSQSSAPSSSIVDNVSHANAVRASVSNGVLPNVLGHGDFARESLILPPQPLSHFNVKGGSLSENRSFFTAGEQKPQVIGNLPNGKLGDTSNGRSTFNPSYDPPAPEIRSADGAAKAWNPAKLPSPHHFPSVSTAPLQMQIRGQFGMNNSPSNIIDHRLNGMFHSDQHLDSSRSTSQINRPQISRTVPLHLQVQASQVEPNVLMPQETRPNFPFPSNASAPSNQMMLPPPYGYLQGHGHHVGTTSSILVPAMQPAWQNISAPNMPFKNIPGPSFPSVIRGQATSQVNSSTQAGGALQVLISSLMAGGVISLSKRDSVGVEFDPDRLKVRHESAITALYADLPRQCTTCGLRFKSQEEHSKHMDWHVNKNRTLKNRKTKPSPKWFVSVNMWLRGAEAVGAEAVPGFFPAENIVEKKDDEENSVPADEDQNACALCGEPFDDFYSDETEVWMYKGAVYMYAPAGSIVGIDKSQLGPIVHVKCRSDSHGLPSEDITRDELESTEFGRQAKRLRS